jgi:hypothetical protein
MAIELRAQKISFLVFRINIKKKLTEVGDHTMGAKSGMTARLHFTHKLRNSATKQNTRQKIRVIFKESAR